jgi:hypothetical protein
MPGLIEWLQTAAQNSRGIVVSTGVRAQFSHYKNQPRSAVGGDATCCITVNFA